jgi:hypothetical protein
MEILSSLGHKSSKILFIEFFCGTWPVFRLYYFLKVEIDLFRCTIFPCLYIQVFFCCCFKGLPIDPYLCNMACTQFPDVDYYQQRQSKIGSVVIRLPQSTMIPRTYFSLRFTWCATWKFRDLNRQILLLEEESLQSRSFVSRSKLPWCTRKFRQILFSNWFIMPLLSNVTLQFEFHIESKYCTFHAPWISIVTSISMKG